MTGRREAPWRLPLTFARFTRLDAALVLMILIWGSNFTIIKVAIRQIPQFSFNALRLLIASALFAALIARRSRADRALLSRFSRAEWLRMALLGILGHTIYQLLFLGGVARTPVATSSLVFGMTPIAIALLSAWLGHERIPPTRWAGALLSLAGIYLVVSYGTRAGHGSAVGVAMMFGAVLSWATYTVGSRPLLATHAPLVVTGLTIFVGTACYVPLAARELWQHDWSRVSAWAWMATLYSASFAIFLAYLIWYTAVQRVGSARTAVYSNLTPVVAMLVAAVALDEPLNAVKVLGAAAVLAGLALTRFEPKAAPVQA